MEPASTDVPDRAAGVVQLASCSSSPISLAIRFSRWERAGVGPFAAHRAVLLKRAGDGDDRVSGGVEDHRFGVALELVANDPVAELGHRRQAAIRVGEARAGRPIRLLAAGCRECWACAISSTGSMFCWRAVRITLIVICWVRAPYWVRFAPQLLRLTIAGRSACSARQFRLGDH